MPESSTNPDDGEHPFDVERFARETIHAIEHDDDIRHVNEMRLLAIEEAIAARWPRRWLLWARLRRELRALAATWDPAYIPRGDFRGRRSEWADQESGRLQDRRRRGRQPEETQTRGWENHTGWDPPAAPAGDAPDPGEGFLP